MTIGNYREEFPDFDDELPVIEGFEDRSWANEQCPCLINEELHLLLFVDYKDPERSEWPEARISGDLGKYTIKRLTEDNYVMGIADDLVLDTDDFDAVIAKIDEIRTERAPAI
jgi:hypothetical protein